MTPRTWTEGNPAALIRGAGPKPLAEANTVYAFDLPGYGSSEKRAGQDVSLAAQGRVLSELLDHWGLDKPAVVGHDIGGAITLRAHLLEGRDFRAIALIDAVALSPWGSPFYRLVQDHVGVFRQIDRKSVV